jgi:hypothetical protein
MMTAAKSQNIPEGGNALRTERFNLMVRMQNHYIQTLRDRKLSEEMMRWVDTTLASVSGPRPEGRILAVIGNSGAGKTWAIERAIKSIPEFKSSILSVTAPRPCTLKQLGREILKNLGYGLKRELREHMVWEKVRDHLEGNNVRFVWIDELQHAFDGKHDTQLGAISDTFKNLAQRRAWPISFLLSGLPVVATFLGRDRQIERRSRTLEFGSLKFPGDAKLIRQALLTSIIQTDAGMRLGDLASDEFIHQLCHATEGAFGSVIDLIRSAVLHAVERPKPDGLVRIDDFASAYAAERGCQHSDNIFLAPNWHQIRPENSRQRDATQEVR